MGNINNVKLIRYPLHSTQLAEFVGAAIGDGGLSKYQLVITLHHIDDKDYTDFIVETIYDLFGIIPAVYHKESRSVRNVTISSRALVIFFNQYINFQVGDKMRQKIDIPDWIKQNQDFSAACMRGLFDTDGSVVLHRYWVGGKRYCYKKLEFCSMSSPLRKSAYDILFDLGMRPRLAREKSVWLDSKIDVKTYFEVIGSHNLKHWKRYEHDDRMTLKETWPSG